MFRCTEEGCSSAYSAASWTSRRQSLQRHLEGDHGVRIRRTTNHCALCSVTLGARPSAHPCLANGNHTAAPIQQRHQCPECPASFPSRKGLGNHRQWHRKQRAGRQALVHLGVSASHGDTTSGVSHGRPATVASCRPAGPCETVRRTPSSASRTRASYASTPAPVGSTVEPPDMQLTPMALPSPNPQLPPEAEQLAKIKYRCLAQFTFAPLLCPRDRVCRSPGDDTVLSDKLQLDSALTLEIAVAAARNSEAVKQQHKEMRGSSPRKAAIKFIVVLPLLLNVSGETSRTEDVSELLAKHPELTSGLGQMNTEYKLVLRPDAKPFALTFPRRVSKAMLPPVKNEIFKMLKHQVIERVTKATEWCAPMVVAEKANGERRVCVDFTELNKYLVRERVIMPTVHECLAKPCGGTVFSKLDARAGC
ncbi:hypothetical protein ISCGN_021885 [Ixodes scapularis]